MSNFNDIKFSAHTVLNHAARPVAIAASRTFWSKLCPLLLLSHRSNIFETSI